MWRASRSTAGSIAQPGGLHVHVARRPGERRRGLSGLDDLAPGHALHIPRCRAVHTFRMRFALDLVWLSRDGEVVRVDRQVPARRHRWCLQAGSVVETRAGEADRFIRAGLGYTARR